MTNAPYRDDLNKIVILNPKGGCGKTTKGIASDEFVMHGNRNWPFRTPKEAGAVIIDTPAALGRREISELTYDADCILVPILPSTLDIQVTTNEPQDANANSGKPGNSNHSGTARQPKLCARRRSRLGHI
jgi:hypothetical protein